MLWLCISLPQLPLEALREDDAHATVVTAREGAARWVVCCNSAAERVSLRAMMNYTTALAVHPQVVMLERKPPAEQAALQRLASWAYQFSATVIIADVPAELRYARSSVLWLEIGASLKLFGGFRRLIEHIERELQELHYTYQLGIAPTLAGAALLAHAGIRIATTTMQALHSRIRNLLISQAPLPPEVVEHLHTAGVRTIGLLLELPADAVTKRFGPEVSLFLDRLTGKAADPRPVFRLPANYQADFEFDFEIGNTQALLFTARRLLREFAGYLRARDVAVQHFTLKLRHRRISTTDLRIGLSRPDRNHDRFFALLREQLERIELQAPIIGFSVCASEFATPTQLQSELFRGASQENEELSHTVDRIAARLGEDHVHGLRPVADHRPEASWSRAPPGEKPATTRFSDGSPDRSPDRPLWLLPQPRPLQLSVTPQIASGPERIEGGWWDGGDVQRDYFVVRTSSGADLWIYQDLSSRCWYLHGFWS